MKYFPIYRLVNKKNLFFGNRLVRNLMIVMISLAVSLTFFNVSQGMSQDRPSSQLNCKGERNCFSENRALYNRTRDPKDLNKALDHAMEAAKQYQQKIPSSGQEWNITALQAELNKLSLVLEVDEWLQSVIKQMSKESWVPTSKIELQEVQRKVGQDTWPSIQRAIVNLPKIENTIDKLSRSSENDEIVYAEINYAESLLRIKNLPGYSEKTSWSTIDKLLELAVLTASSSWNKQVYASALNYRGRFYEKLYVEKQKDLHQNKEKLSCTENLLTCARKQTELALKIIDSEVPSLQKGDTLWRWQNIAYQSEAQLGRIHEDIQLKIAAYSAAVQTLEAMRKDLRSTATEIQFSFRDEVQPIYREYVSLLLPKDNNDAENLEKARSLIENLQLAELENFLGCDLPITKTADNLANDDPSAAIVYPIILPDRVEVIVSLPTSDPQKRDLKHYSTPISDQKAGQILRELRYRLELPYVSKRTKDLSKQVLNWIIKKEFWAGLNINTLLFIPDGLLRNIPMAALEDGEGHYLIEKYAVAIAPRLQLLSPKPGRNRKALIAGLTQDPDPSNFSPDEPVLGKLKYASTEIERLEQQLQHFNIRSEVLDGKTGKEFSWKNLRQELKAGSYNILHLTTHGLFGSNSGKTFIVTESGKLKLEDLEVFFRDNNIDPISLLVLSACETATGDDRDTLGIAGMTVRLRAQTTLATLWSIDEETSSKVMELFYQERFGNKRSSKAEALRQAMIRMIKDEKVSYPPSQWAPYVLVGDWR
jgi:CHAT domain-containing protein